MVNFGLLCLLLTEQDAPIYGDEPLPIFCCSIHAFNPLNLLHIDEQNKHAYPLVVLVWLATLFVCKLFVCCVVPVCSLLVVLLNRRTGDRQLPCRHLAHSTDVGEQRRCKFNLSTHISCSIYTTICLVSSTLCSWNWTQPGQALSLYLEIWN